ncbi:MAG: peptide deformylase [Gammaproteobacteria bacterium]
MNVGSNAIREIVQLGAQVLRLIAEPVGDVSDPQIAEIAKTLFATLADSQGVGLAAPQIGESVRMIVVGSRPTARYPYAPQMQPTLMINPQFEALSDEKEKDWEGCLSIPGIRALVPRFKKIAVNYSDAKGNAQHARFAGFVARVFQHEYDHLDGLVYLDRVETNRDIISEQEFLKLVEKQS